MLGFEQAANADGPMDYPNVDLVRFWIDDRDLYGHIYDRFPGATIRDNVDWL